MHCIWLCWSSLKLSDKVQAAAMQRWHDRLLFARWLQAGVDVVRMEVYGMASNWAALPLGVHDHLLIANYVSLSHMQVSMHVQMLCGRASKLGS